nr:Kruppel homolog 1 protein isoform B [Ischnura senegalensis]
MDLDLLPRFSPPLGQRERQQPRSASPSRRRQQTEGTRGTVSRSRRKGTSSSTSNNSSSALEERLWARVSEMVGYFNSSDMSPLKEDEEGALGVTLLPASTTHHSATTRIDCTPVAHLRPASPRPPPSPANQVSSSTGGDKPFAVKSVVCSPDFPVFQYFPAAGAEGGGGAGTVPGGGAAAGVGATGPQGSAPAVAAEVPAPSTTTPTGKASFQCPLCGKVSASKTAHQNHLRVHAKEGKELPPPQPQQQRSSGAPQQSPQPVSGQQQQADPYPCTMCGKTFAVPARLTRHFRTHTGEKPYQCEFCSKAFSVKENLSVHRRIHTKERPYKCDVCARAFEHSGKLHRHARIHTGERPHRCTVCDKTFIQSGQLVIHMRTHTGEKPYVCKSCGKGFTCSKQLKVHTRTHTGEKPYSCEICGKAFGYNHVLKLHQVAHFGEKVYKCTICHETFNSKKTMESHIKSHSGGATSSTSVPSPQGGNAMQGNLTSTPSPPPHSPSPQTQAYSPPPQIPQPSRLNPDQFSGGSISQRHGQQQQSSQQQHQQQSQQLSQPHQPHQQTHQQPLQQLHHQSHPISSGDYEATSSSVSSISSVTTPSSSSDKENRNCPSVSSDDSEMCRRLGMMVSDGVNDGQNLQRMQSPYSNHQQMSSNGSISIHQLQTHPSSPHQMSQPQGQSSPSSPVQSFQHQPVQQQERDFIYISYRSGEALTDGTTIFQPLSSPSSGYLQSQGPQSPVATQVGRPQHIGLSPMLLAAVGLSVEDEEEEDRKNMMCGNQTRDEQSQGQVMPSSPLVGEEGVLIVEDPGVVVEDEEEDDEENESIVVASNAGQTVLTVTEPPIYVYPEAIIRSDMGSGVELMRVRTPTAPSTSPEPNHNHHLHQSHPILRHYSPPYILPSLPSSAEGYSSSIMPPVAPTTPPGNGKRRRGEAAPLLTPPSSNPVSPATSAVSSASSEPDIAAPHSGYSASMREVLILPPRKRSKLILQSMEETSVAGVHLTAGQNSETMQQSRVSSVIQYAEKSLPTA